MKVLAKLLVVGVVLAGAGFASTAAQAGNPGYCGSIGSVCIYEDNDFQNGIGKRDPNETVKNVAGQNDDKMDSWENNTEMGARWYHDDLGDGRCVDMGAQREDNNINFADSDQLTSWATNGLC